jgi:hypothetical protein
MNPQKKVAIPLLLLFVFINTFLLFANNFLLKIGADKAVLIWANLICFSINIIALFLSTKSLKNANPNAFVRAVMAGMLVKMFVFVAAVLVYVMRTGSNYNKPAVVISLFLYLIYMVVEVATVLKLNKKKDA